MCFLKVLGKTEFRFEFSVKNYVFQHGTKFLHFLKVLGKTEFRFEFSVNNYVLQHLTTFLLFVDNCNFCHF